MKNILVISGSHKKKGTGITLVDMFKSNFENEYSSFETIHLSDLDIKYCIGCTACFKVSGDACPRKDDVKSVLDKMEKADGIIFVSPIYSMNISGQLKTFLDRITYTYHRPMFIAKPVIFFASTDVGGISLVGNYMKYILDAMGMRTVATFGVLAKPFKMDEKYRAKSQTKLEKIYVEFSMELNRTVLPKPKFSELFHFTKWQAKNRYSKDIYPADYKYWNNNGWFESEYYYQVNLGVLDKLRLIFVRKKVASIVKKSV
ncbi:MAG: NAD(P)H-dependent oxidoreductase [Acidaminobacteraceae bacterium]